MLLTRKRFTDLTAGDLMTSDVITLPRAMSLRAAAHLLAQAGVSGAPVIDEDGCCVGVLSKTDLVRFLDESPAVCRCRRLASDDVFADWQVLNFECLPSEEVSRYMTTRIISAGPHTPVADLARLMHQNHVHRVLIADGDRRVIGVVSSMDVLAAIAADEPPLCD